MGLDISQGVSRRRVLLAIGAALTAGCSGSADRTSTDSTSDAQEPTTGPTDAAETPTDDWNATVAIDAEKASLAAGDYVYNGWNVSIEVTSVNGADEVIYVYEAVNVQKGNATREGVVGSEPGDATTENELFLLQRNETVTVYAVRGDERKRIGSRRINSSYLAPWDGERDWNDTWRGERPDGGD